MWNTRSLLWERVSDAVLAIEPRKSSSIFARTSTTIGAGRLDTTMTQAGTSVGRCSRTLVRKIPVPEVHIIIPPRPLLHPVFRARPLLLSPARCHQYSRTPILHVVRVILQEPFGACVLEAAAVGREPYGLRRRCPECIIDRRWRPERELRS